MRAFAAPQLPLDELSHLLAIDGNDLIKPVTDLIIVSVYTR